jgi:acyl carrier protein
MVNLAGEALKPELVENIFAETEAETVCNLYGPSETTTYSTWVAMDRGKGFEPSIGRPIANTQIYILDEWLNPTPMGAPGEIHIGGDGKARGYLNRPELTAERFLPDPFSREPGVRSYKTGDLGRWAPEGTIEFLGRNDNQVKIRGYRIELGEIETRLSSHPGTHEAVVVAREDGEGGRKLVAYYTGEKVGVEALRDYLTSALPYYMIPAAYVHLERLPLTPNGKLDRRALPAPDKWSAEERDGYLPPQTPIEEIVIRIFEDVLKLEGVGRKDNFFDLGGHSLLATQVISRVRKSFGVEIGVGSVFEEPAVEGLASRIEEALKAGKKDEAPPLVRVSREERLPLSFAQQRLWFLDQLDPGNAAYNVPEALALKGDLNIEALERAINEIIRRHEILRTRIEVEVGEPIQVIDKWEPRRLEVIDLRRWPREEKEAEVRNRIRAEAETGFYLRNGPLLRVKALKLEEEEHVILYTMSHIVSDGWSMGILMREVGVVYQAYLAGELSPLEELDIQYADYAKWQRQYLQGELLNEQLEYWRTHLGGNLPKLKLVTERHQVQERTHRRGLEFTALPPELTRRIVELSRSEGVTLFMTLLAAFKVLLSRYSGQEDIIVGTVIANRNSIELERLIGFFLSTLPLRTNLAGDPTFRELLARVRKVVLGAYAHQNAPFEKLVDELQPERNLNQTPFFRVAFLLQNTPAPTGRLQELTSSPVAPEGGKVKNDLTMSMMETSQGLVGGLEYDVDLFDSVGMKTMLVHFRTLLENIVESPDRPLSSLRLLSDMESQGQRPLDFPDLQLSQRDLEKILIEIGNPPSIETM